MTHATEQTPLDEAQSVVLEELRLKTRQWAAVDSLSWLVPTIARRLMSAWNDVTKDLTVEAAAERDAMVLKARNAGIPDEVIALFGLESRLSDVNRAAWHAGHENAA